MASETKVQEIVHRLEEGRWAPWIKLAVLLSAIAFVVNLWFFRDAGFKGLSHAHAMDQAQISRELARGNGFTTKVIRPAAIWLFQHNKGVFPVERTPDVFHAPLSPFLNSFILRLTKDSWEMTAKDNIYTSDRAIAAVSLGFFLLSVLVNYFVARRLFDHRLALLGVGILLLCETFWDFSMSGLPQMLMLFLFSIAALLLLRAVEARCDGRPALPWLAGMGVAFGLLALTHALTIWMFAGALFFCLLYFRPIGRDAAIMLAIFSLCYAPWLIRNQKVCGSPVGLSWYSALLHVKGSESMIMRNMEIPLEGISPRSYGAKVRLQTIYQLTNFYDFCGAVLLAPVFFISLLHLFKTPATAALRWGVLSMWLFAVLGMSVFGFSEAHGLRSNDLHVLFIPLLTFYGLAFVLVMWTRLELHYRIVRIAFLTLVVGSSALPFSHQFLSLLGGPQLPWQWPPYIPPWISVLRQWTTESEIITTDMPWAVAWYADRKSLWLPLTVKEFINLNDYAELKGQIVGLYLTPITGNSSFISEVVKGEYKEWAPFIMRKVDIRDFPLKAVTSLPKDNECIFYADRDRWTNRED